MTISFLLDRKIKSHFSDMTGIRTDSGKISHYKRIILKKCTGDRNELAIKLGECENNMSSKLAGQLFEIITKIPSEELEGYINQAIQVLPLSVSPFEKEGVIKALTEIPQSMQLITSYMGGYDRKIIIKALAGIPPDQRGLFITQAKKLITDGMEGYEKSNIIKALAEITSDQRNLFITQAKQLITDGMEGYYKANIIKALAEITSDQRDPFITQAKQLITEDMDKDEREFIIQALEAIFLDQQDQQVLLSIKDPAKMPEDQRYSLITQAIKWIIRRMSPVEKMIIIKALAKIPPDQRDSFLDQARLLHGIDNMSGHEKMSIIKALAEIPQAIQLIRPNMSAFNREIIIKALAGIPPIPPDQRAPLITQAKKLITDGMGAGDKVSIIKTLAEITSDQRAPLITQAKKLITDGMGAGDKVSIIETLAKIPPDQRDSFVTQAKQVFEPYTNTEIIYFLQNGHTIQSERFETAIIKALAKIPRNQRDPFITQAKRLITEGMEGYDTSNIIKTLAEIPPDQRDSFLDQAMRFWQGGHNMSGYKKMSIIETLAKIPPDQRDSFLDQAMRFWHGGHNMSGCEKMSIIEALAEIPQAMQLITSNMDGFERNSIMRTLARIPQDQREQIVTRAIEDLQRHIPYLAQRTARTLQLLELPLGQPIPPLWGRMEALAAQRATSINVHHGDRDSKSAKAFLLLKETASTEIDIPGEVNNFKEYLNTCGLDATILEQVRQVVGWKALNNESCSHPALLGNTISTADIIQTTGDEVLARVWMFVKECEDSEIAKKDVVNALSDCLVTGTSSPYRICQAGKLQHLMLVLQGRLEGVNIDGVDTPKAPLELTKESVLLFNSKQEVGEALNDYIMADMDKDDEAKTEATQKLTELITTYLNEIPEVKTSNFYEEFNRVTQLNLSPN